MGKKVDYKKDYKELYRPKTSPEIVEVPRMPFFTVGGSGDPNGEEFAMATEALYSMSYAVKMSYKSENVPDGYYEYTVFPLEGEWDLLDRSKPATDKSNFKYTIMIRQPDFLTEQHFERFLEQTKRKRANPFLEKIRFEHVEDGLNCQMMHIGSFDEEPESFARMEAFCTEQGFIRSSKIHREIYLSDPRKTEPSKLKTVLRFPVNTRDRHDS
ncbi:GyrI-like domain-containing protein [Paenibacillus arenilitoris]|uniref:GyrI-like domain-containing protein n=1 Tax=Paenibacillus arenilitoris TaxID=2772299 RepID=UPI001CC2670D|nr:GyrI-like domain-containing protein [Paenibacillus arenilitoris]